MSDGWTLTIVVFLLIALAVIGCYLAGARNHRRGGGQ